MARKTGQEGDSYIEQKDPEDIILETNHGRLRKLAPRNSLTPSHPMAAAERGHVGARYSRRTRWLG